MKQKRLNQANILGFHLLLELLNLAITHNKHFAERKSFYKNQINVSSLHIKDSFIS